MFLQTSLMTCASVAADMKIRAVRSKQFRIPTRAAGYSTLLMFVAACSLYDASLVDPPEALTGASDSAPVLCVVRLERCNGDDDDCDGLIDEDADSRCALPHAIASCSGGACVLDACEPGYFNCNSSALDGCELIADARECGECGRRCEGERSASAKMVERTPAPTQKSEGARDAGVRPANAPAQPDEDAGNHCGSESGCGERPDDPVSESTAADAVSACTAPNPSGQTQACDSCACDKCASALSECYSYEGAAWTSACGEVTRCYGVNLAERRCRNGDCNLSGFGVCAAEEARSATWGNWRYSCSALPGAPRTPCDASVYLRECLGTNCSEVCAFTSP